ncbi:MAG: PAC2 family protein [Phycisphaeraceae bacterium]|nr:PAC2 family protein [Phycisphaeraceae bacterium]
MAEPQSTSKRSSDPDGKPAWLVAAWPGMGNVAILAAGYLMQKLSLKPVDELTVPSYFDVQAVEVTEGNIATPRLPRSYFFRPTEPLESGVDLTVFIGEAQPATGSFAFAHALLERAARWKPTRIVTFASMASQMHPSQRPRVIGAATDAQMLDELRRIEVDPMAEGQIGGMNGVLLGAASERTIPGLCLLGEIPYFAAGVANPRAAHAVLAAFGLLSGVEVELAELESHAEKVDAALIDMLERMERAAQERGDEEEEDFNGAPDPGLIEPTTAPAGEPAKPAEEPIDPAVTAKIERLFKQAAKDRAKAVQLKKELDKHNLFKRFENRFLDLFRRAE